MSERVVVDCDRCSEKSLAAPIRVHVDTGVSADPCEGSTVDSERLDLCPRCAAWAFGVVARRLSHPEGAKLVEEVRRHKHQVK